jgi:hypothetical protein
MALPLNEGVSRCCRAVTVPPLPSCVACTIRAWSRRTFWWAVGQGMACQPARSWAGAPAAGEAVPAVLGVPSSVGSPHALVMRDQREVGVLAHGSLLPGGSPPLAGSGKRDYSRPLPSEPDVKVSLHPAQASQRPCEGPVSMRKTCWLHDTGRQSIPLRGK